MSGLNPEVLDTHGNASPYRAEYDARSHTVQALLPDGDYTLRVTAFGPSKPFVNSSGGIVTNLKNLLSGQADVSVAGHAITNLRVALGPDSANPLEVIVNRSGNAPPQQENGNGAGVFISASLAGADAPYPMSTQFAQGNVPGTSGDASPWRRARTGFTPQSLRQDCASLPSPPAAPIWLASPWWLAQMDQRRRSPLPSATTALRSASSFPSRLHPSHPASCP